MQHINTLRRFCVALGVGGREKYGKTYEFFKERQQQDFYHCENIIFFVPTSNFLRKHGTDFFFLFKIMCISSVPNSFKSFAFGKVLYKNLIALGDVSGKIFLHSALNYGTF